MKTSLKKSLPRLPASGVNDPGEKLHLKERKVSVDDGFLKIKGTVKTHYAENILRDKIVEISGQKPRVILVKKLTQTTGRR